jgi:hypothetical protein
MNHRRPPLRRVLAAFPSTHGFGFAVFEGPFRPIDWGLKRAPRQTRTPAIRKLADLIEWYQPAVLVLENHAGEGSRKSPRVQRVIAGMAGYAGKRNLALASYSRHMIRQAFAETGAVTKHEIAQLLARDFPELAPRLPPVRRLWMTEDCRMAMFDAASLALTFFHFESLAARSR